MDKNAEQLAEQIFSWLSFPTDVNLPTEHFDPDWEIESLHVSSGEEVLEMVCLNPNKPAPIQELSQGQCGDEKLLKQKLKTKIERCPPCFPWETERGDDEEEAVAQKAQWLGQSQLTY